MNLKEIKEKLAKLKTEKEKLEFLQARLKEAKDADIKAFLLDELAKLIASDQDDNLPAQSSLSRMISTFQPEQRETLQPVRSRSLDSRILSLSSNMQENDEQKQSSYITDSYKLSNQDYSGLSSNYGFIDSNIVTDLRDKFIREGIFQENKTVSTEQLDTMRNKLKQMMPGIREDQIEKYEQDITGRNRLLYKKTVL